jgi:hypothetical protein
MRGRRMTCLCLALAAVFFAAGAGPAVADSWLDSARYARYGTIPPPPPAVRPAPRETQSLNVDSHAFAREHGFAVWEVPRRAFLSNQGDLFDYQPGARIYIAPTPGTSDAGHGRKSIAPAAIFLQPNYSMYNTYSRRFGRGTLASPLRPGSSALSGATPRILHFNARTR